MSNRDQTEAKLRAALWAAIAELGEKEAKRICDECLNTLADRHYNSHLYAR